MRAPPPPPPGGAPRVALWVVAAVLGSVLPVALGVTLLLTRRHVRAVRRRWRVTHVTEISMETADAG